MHPKTLRTTLSLPAELALQISEVAKSLGVSQSALVATILESPLGQLAMHQSIADPRVRDGDGALRLRGESAHEVRRLIEEALAAMCVDDGGDRGGRLL